MIYKPKPPMTRQLQIEFREIFELHCVIREHRFKTLERVMYMGFPDFPIARSTYEAQMIAEIAKPFLEQIEQAKQAYFESEKIIKTLWNFGAFNGIYPYYV